MSNIDYSKPAVRIVEILGGFPNDDDDIHVVPLVSAFDLNKGDDLYLKPQLPKVPDDDMVQAGVMALIRGLKVHDRNYAQIVSNIWEDMRSINQKRV